MIVVAMAARVVVLAVAHQVMVELRETAAVVAVEAVVAAAVAAAAAVANWTLAVARAGA